ncbi:MAG: UDP-N-acetylglucosamine--N-acetylmuramyl-(pentapeptide) pyrophosphoryl-undecaprenol N-acetylglucosamine transferase [Acidimicrobiales bacterium]
MPAPRPWALISGGGTAGHISPGLAIAEALVGRGVAREEIGWMGSARGLETRLVPEAGFALTALPGRGIQRRLTPANLRALAGLIAGVVLAIGAFARRRPAIVVALGGYASVPGVLAAIVWRVPIVLTEQNAVPSAANRLASRFARACAAPFPESSLPRSTWTGNPVRPEIVAVDRGADGVAARHRLGLAPEQRLLLVMGGSLGARRINEALLAALPSWADRDDLAIHHVAGARDHDSILGRIGDTDLGALDYRLVRYEDDMASVYAAADLALCRAGGNTVAELAVVGLASVLVPLPGAPGDHQTANAGALAAVHAAVVVPDGELDGTRLRTVVDDLLADDDRRIAMHAAAASIGRPDAPVGDRRARGSSCPYPTDRSDP